MRDDLSLTTCWEGFVVSSLLIGAAFGALIGGRLADSLGRKRSLMVCAALFFLGAIGTATAPSLAPMIASRIVLGLAVGAASAVVPLFLAEMAPANRRGRIVTINELMIVSGQLVAFIVNAGLDRWYDGPSVWRWMLAIAAIPALLLFVGMMTLPDSPRWYALKGRHDDARRVLERTRPPPRPQEEYESVVEHAKRDLAEDKGKAWSDLRAYVWMRRIVFVGIGLAVVQQATGINTAIYYAPTILESTGLGTSAALVATIAVGVISVTMTLVGIVLLGFMNRRPLLITGFSGVAALPGRALAVLPAARVDPAQLPRARVHGQLRRLRPVLHRHRRLAAALGDLPDGDPRLRDGHRRLHALDRQRDDLAGLPAARRGRGRERDVRPLRLDQHRARSCSSRAACPRPAAARSKSSKTSSAPTAARSSTAAPRPRSTPPDRYSARSKGATASRMISVMARTAGRRSLPRRRMTTRSRRTSSASS